VRDVGSSSFLVTPMTADMLGIEVALVPGYVGRASRVLALLRGEVDLVVANYGSMRPSLQAAELTPLLQIAGDPVSGQHLPRLSQEAERRSAAGLTPYSTPDVRRLTRSLETVVSGGRFIAAPLNLPSDIQHCLEDTLQEILTSDELIEASAAAGLRVSWSSGPETTAALRRAADAIGEFAPLLERATSAIRER
jgi:tripartite-type tricarboxylate transporter receptor subunit TctC